MRLRNLALVLVMAASFAGAQDAKKTPPAKAEDPVCGMTIDTKDAPKSDFKGKTYYFCSISDKQEFDKAPASYIKVDKKDTTKK